LASGLAFELDGYTGCTLEDMRAWQLTLPEVLDVKLESIAASFDTTMREIFEHLGFPEADHDDAVAIAAAEDIARMDDASLAANQHVHGRTLSKWCDLLSTSEVRLIESRYGEVIRDEERACGRKCDRAKPVAFDWPACEKYQASRE
jgi:hypothetical protein